MIYTCIFCSFCPKIVGVKKCRSPLMSQSKDWFLRTKLVEKPVQFQPGWPEKQASENQASEKRNLLAMRPKDGSIYTILKNSAGKNTLFSITPSGEFLEVQDQLFDCPTDLTGFIELKFNIDGSLLALVSKSKICIYSFNNQLQQVDIKQANCKQFEWCPFDPNYCLLLTQNNSFHWFKYQHDDLVIAQSKIEQQRMKFEIPQVVDGFAWGDQTNPWLKYSIFAYGDKKLLHISPFLPPDYLMSHRTYTELLSTLSSEDYATHAYLAGNRLAISGATPGMNIENIGTHVKINVKSGFHQIGTKDTKDISSLYWNDGSLLVCYTDGSVCGYKFEKFENWQYSPDKIHFMSFLTNSENLPATSIPYQIEGDQIEGQYLQVFQNGGLFLKTDKAVYRIRRHKVIKLISSTDKISGVSGYNDQDCSHAVCLIKDDKSNLMNLVYLSEGIGPIYPVIKDINQAQGIVENLESSDSYIAKRAEEVEARKKALLERQESLRNREAMLHSKFKSLKSNSEKIHHNIRVLFDQLLDVHNFVDQEHGKVFRRPSPDERDAVQYLINEAESTLESIKSQPIMTGQTIGEIISGKYILTQEDYARVKEDFRTYQRLAQEVNK